MTVLQTLTFPSAVHQTVRIPSAYSLHSTASCRNGLHRKDERALFPCSKGIVSNYLPTPLPSLFSRIKGRSGSHHTCYTTSPSLSHEPIALSVDTIIHCVVSYYAKRLCFVANYTAVLPPICISGWSRRPAPDPSSAGDWWHKNSISGFSISPDRNYIFLCIHFFHYECDAGNLKAFSCLQKAFHTNSTL